MTVMMIMIMMNQKRGSFKLSINILFSTCDKNLYLCVANIFGVPGVANDLRTYFEILLSVYECAFSNGHFDNGREAITFLKFVKLADRENCVFLEGG